MSDHSGFNSIGPITFSGTNHAGIKLNSLTTTQRDALTAANGMVIYNTTTNTVQKYENSAWADISSGGGGAPTTASYVTLGTDGTLSNERVLTGTSNQITLTDGGAGGNVTLSTPQDIHTGASPTFAGLNLGTGNLSTVGNISMGGTAARDMTVAANAASSAGSSLTLAGGASGSGTDLAGGTLILKSGAGTGTGTSAIQFWTNKPASSTGSGTGTSVNVLSMSISATGTITLAPANATSGAGSLTVLQGGPPQATSNVAGGDLRLQGAAGRGTGAGGATIIYSAPAGSTGSTLGTLAERFRVDASGNVSVGTAAISTSATDGFMYIPTCAGAPSGTPTSKTGLVPMVYDSTNNNFYLYSGGSWKKTTTFA